MTGHSRNQGKVTEQDLKARLDNYRVVMIVVGVFVGTAHIYTVPESNINTCTTMTRHVGFL